MAYVHFRNLSRGFLCGCSPSSAHIVRIQSTACEQKRWGAILHEVGGDFLYNLAIGNTCVVHDRSERDRETRACWQGLSWIRYATHRAWRDTAPPPEFSRGGMVITPYWEEQFWGLPRSTRNLLKFYKQFDKGTLIDLYSCYMPGRRKHETLVAQGRTWVTTPITPEASSTDDGGSRPDYAGALLPSRASRIGFVPLSDLGRTL